MNVELVTLAEPRYVDAPALRIAGLTGEYTREQTIDIPKQWDKFNADLFAAGLADNWTYGVVYPLATMRYVTGVEVQGASFPPSWTEVIIPAQRYVVFAETGGLPNIRPVWMTIFQSWLPKSGLKAADGPMLERYPADWVTSGNFEIWIPVA